MTEPFAVSQDPSPKSLTQEPVHPILLLSSEEAGWEGLVVRVFHEPREFEGVIAPDADMPHIPLVLFTGGAMYMEGRPANGSWKGTLIRPNDLILTPDGNITLDELRWKGLTPASMQTLHLHLSKDLLARTAEELADSDPACLVLKPRFGFQDPLLTHIGLALWRELEQQNPIGKLYAQTSAQMLAVHLLRHYTSTPYEIKERSQGLTRQQMARVIDFILAHLTQDLSLEALAQQVGFSPYHFAHVFRQSAGESPHQFVLRQRVERAQRLLKETDAPLADIALESGFANQSHLTRIFKRQLGFTPRVYRQEDEIRAPLYQDSQE